MTNQSAPHILLATDLSNESKAAFEPVAQLVRRTAARVTLLHAVSLDIASTRRHPDALRELGPEFESHVSAITERLDELATELRQSIGCDATIEHDIAVGPSTHYAIRRYARDHRVTVIALMTHGRSGLGRLVLGSVAEAILRKANIPVLICPVRDEWAA